MKIKKLIYGLLGAGGVLVACDKIEEGYMSSNIYYVTDPFTVEQGLTTYSEALELDNSTGPVNVELLDIRNVETGKILCSLIRPFRSIRWEDGWNFPRVL